MILQTGSGDLPEMLTSSSDLSLNWIRPIWHLVIEKILSFPPESTNCNLYMIQASNPATSALVAFSSINRRAELSSVLDPGHLRPAYISHNVFTDRFLPLTTCGFTKSHSPCFRAPKAQCEPAGNTAHRYPQLDASKVESRESCT